MSFFKKKMLKKEYSLVLLVFFLSFGFYLFILTRYPLIYGSDGPYYLLQVNSLLENGHLEYGDPPLSFFIFSFFTLLFNEDITFGIRFSVALFSALTAIPLYFWTKKVTNSQFSGYISMFACTFSAPHIRLLHGALKNAVGTFFLMCFLYYLYSIVVEKVNRRDLIIVTIFLILTASTHVLDLGVALLFLMLYPIIALLFNINEKKYLLENIGLLVSVILIFSLITYFSFPTLFSDFTKGFSFLNDFVFKKSQGNAIEYLLRPFEGIFIIPILLIGLIASIYDVKTHKKTEAVTIITVTIIGLLLSFPTIPDNWFIRFILMEFIPMAYIVGYVSSKVQSNMISQIIFFSFMLLLIYQSVVYSRRLGPSITVEEHQEIQLIAQFISPNSIIVSPRHRYWIQYITKSNISRNSSPDLWDTYDEVFFILDKKLSQSDTVPSNSTMITEKTRFVLYKLNESTIVY